MVHAWKWAAGAARAGALRTADWAGEVVRSVPGVAGALMVAWGLGQMYGPLLWITLGVFALAVDRRMA